MAELDAELVSELGRRGLQLEPLLQSAPGDEAEEQMTIYDVVHRRTA